MTPRLSLPFIIAGVLGVAAGADTGKTLVLVCELTNSVPRSEGQPCDPPFMQAADLPFTWRFRVNLALATVDGGHATVTDSQAGWAGRAAPAQPSATLSRPDGQQSGSLQLGWQFHPERQIGRVRNVVSGPCVEAN